MAEEASKLRGLEGSGGGIRNQAVPDRASAVPTIANSSPTTVYLAGQEEDDYACRPRGRVSGPQPKDYNKDLTCEYHQGEVGHTVENCRVLRHRIQDLLDQGVLKVPDRGSHKYNWEQRKSDRRHQKSRQKQTHAKYHPGAQDHNLQNCEEFKKGVASLITRGLIRRSREQPERDCMTIDQLRLSPYERTNFQASVERIKEDFEEFCEKKKEELGKLSPATSPEMSKPDPVIIQYATKEKIMLQTASVSTVQSSEKVPSVVIQVSQYFPQHCRHRRKIFYK
uniref:Retrotransposon gag domain-containing protein n=1 Tax=Fagus sylvatica TaxID=28930 RepID=A0A2N9G2B8_FAGSY